ncbi:MAG: energy-coupling factor transporter transmembrane protein EcfT [Oscillospiraceae bacterium]|nr:energy-coupling factor transporter transmembrane protein EcfT [Oscillospiraceae bacterium]
MNNITFGQYYHKKSLIHSLDARIKLILMIGFTVVAFLANSAPAVLLTGFCVVIFMAFSRVPLWMYLRTLKAIWFLVLFTAVFNCFYFPGRELVSFSLFSWELTVTVEGLRQCLLLASRLISLILVSSVLSYTTSPTSMTAAMESLMAPLKIIRVPVHDLAMMMSLALRFVPTLLEEANKIMAAQKARGADLDSGGVIKRIRAVIPILVPLFVSALRRAFDLALAMECRCYSDGKGRTRLNPMRIRIRDAAAFVFVSACGFGIVWLSRNIGWREALDYAKLALDNLI